MPEAASNVPVRLILDGGHSPIPTWPLASLAPGSYLGVGAGPTCQWRVQGPGMQLLHCVLYWDGQTVWVADLEQAGVLLDGVTVTDWAAVRPGATISLGAVSLRLQGTAEDSGKIPQPGPKPPDMEDTKRRIAAAAANSSEQAASEGDSSTRPQNGAGEKGQRAGDSATHIFRSGKKTTEKAPVFGGAALSGSSTRILSSSESAQASSVPPPRISKRAQEPTTGAPEEQRHPSAVGAGENLTAGSVVASTAASVEDRTAVPASSKPPEHASSPVPSSTAAAEAGPAADGKFAMPPPPKPAANPVAYSLHLAKKGFAHRGVRYGFLALVALLAIVVVGAAVIAAFNSSSTTVGQQAGGGTPASEGTPPAFARQGREQLPPPPDTLRLENRERPVATEGLPARPRGAREDASAAARPAKRRPRGRAARRRRTRTASLERQAADALRQRDTSKAVQLYRQLQEQFPSNRAFPTILKILADREEDAPQTFGTPLELREQHIDRREPEPPRRRRGRRGRRGR